MERKVDIQELSNFLMDYTTSMMGVGVHTARAVRSVSRIAESFGYGIDVTIFQKNITMTTSIWKIILSGELTCGRFLPWRLTFK